MNQVSFERVNNDILLIRFAGRWQLSGGLAPSGAVERELQAFPSLARVAFDARDLGDWDSSILTVLARVRSLCRQRQVASMRTGYRPVFTGCWTWQKRSRNGWAPASQ